jgi:hypothetical protein
LACGFEFCFGGGTVGFGDLVGVVEEGGFVVGFFDFGF